MTPEQRASYNEWQRSHKPGGPGARQRARQDREARQRIARMLADEDASDGAPAVDIFS
jgi:hypothetical protein